MNTKPFVIALTACASLILWSASAHAQGTEDNPGGLNEYRAQALELRGTFILLPGLRELYKGGKPAYGNVSDIFAGSANALAHYRAYQAFTGVSAVTGLLGIAAVVSGILIGPPWRSGRRATASALLTGGGVLLFFGAFFWRDLAYSRLNDAVNTFNDELALRFR